MADNEEFIFQEITTIEKYNILQKNVQDFKKNTWYLDYDKKYTYKMFSDYEAIEDI